MNLLLLAGVGSLFATGANIVFKKNVREGSSSCYLLFYFLVSFLIGGMFILGEENVPFCGEMFGVGCAVGALNMGMMWLTAEALKRGPSGITFMFQNSSCLFPGVILFFLFGAEYGFEMRALQWVGMGLVLGGLWVGSGAEKGKISWKWLGYALGCFGVQILALSMIHWRCLLWKGGVSHALIPWELPEIADYWFLPGQFLTAFLLQLGVVFWEGRRGWEIRSPLFKSAFYGVLGGGCNGMGTLCLCMATKIALPKETGLVFPCFAVMTVVLCNLWAARFYGERFTLSAHILAGTGLFLGLLA